MVGEANAAIEGALAGGADEVIVNDSHGGMYNLTPADLHPAARVLQGQKAWSMVAGAGPEAGIDVALFVGYHARAGHPTATIAHTYTGRPTLTKLNGQPVGESGLNASILGAWGIPVGLVAGDDALAEEIATWLPWSERVVVKDGVGSNAALSHHPTVAQDLVRAGAERAVRRASVGRAATTRGLPPGHGRGGVPPSDRGRLCRPRAGRGTVRRSRASGSPPTIRSRRTGRSSPASASPTFPTETGRDGPRDGSHTCRAAAGRRAASTARSDRDRRAHRPAEPAPAAPPRP